MKIPKTFVPDNNLENKVEDLLKPANPVKKSEEQADYTKRKILVHSNSHTTLLDNEIYVFVTHPESQKGYTLYAKSLYKFFHPISGSNHVPALLGNKKIKAHVRNEGMLIEYLNSLRFINDGRLAWKGDKYIQKLKEEYEGWRGFTKYVMSEDENT